MAFWQLNGPPDHSFPNSRGSASKSSSSGPSGSGSRGQSKRLSPLEETAQTTLKAIKDGQYSTHDGKIHSIAEFNRASLDSGTVYYPPDDRLLESWKHRPETSAPPPTTKVHFRLQSTVSASREWAWGARAPYERVGVLNCGASQNPGGGFRDGARSQEASLTRASNLFNSLTSTRASPFYQLHHAELNNGFFSHAMIFSKDIVLFKDDLERWSHPLPVDVLTSTPVDALTAHAMFANTPRDRVEALIEGALLDRMGMILRVFEASEDSMLILTGFGAGRSGNSITLIAKLWARLLGAGGRFHNVFQDVVFALLADDEFSMFCKAFSQETTRLEEEARPSDRK